LRPCPIGVALQPQPSAFPTCIVANTHLSPQPDIVTNSDQLESQTNTAMRLELLPAELQLDIFSYLDNVSLKAARGVSRKLRDNASPALFRSIVACARYDALGAFQKISLDSVLQKYVKEIVFDASVYDGRLANYQHLYEQQNDKYIDLRATSYWSKRTW